MPVVKVTIDKNGTTKIDVEGYSGPDCTKLTQSLEDALGVVERKEFKPEYYDEAPVHIGNKLGTSE